MPRTLLVLLLFSLPALLQTSTPDNAPAHIADWRNDIDTIVADLRLLHPDPFTKVGRLTFLREAEAFKKAIPAMTEEQRVVRAMRLVASIGDGHTMLEPHTARFGWWYPVRLYEFTDGYFITSAHKSVADLAGAQVLEIAGRPVEEVMAAARTLVSADNEFNKQERLFAVHSAGLMKGLGFASADGTLQMKFKLRNGKIEERTLTPQSEDTSPQNERLGTFMWQFSREMRGLPFDKPKDWISAYKDLPASAFTPEDPAMPLHLAYFRPYTKRALPLQDAYFIQLSAVGDGMYTTVKEALNEVDKLKPKRLIIDLRYNFGGDGGWALPAIREFIKRNRNDDKPWKELYVLTGRKTFSAGIMVLDQFLEHTACTVVGEPAGAGFNSYGDHTERDLPKTGLVLHVSTLRHELTRSSDVSEFIPVDVPAPFSFADYGAGRDPAVDPILRGEEMRSIAQIAKADGGAAARKVYLERRARFAAIPWYQPPGELDLRLACDDLLEQKRIEDAMETCKLNTEIHPDLWNTWLNLASAQKAAGQMQERLESLSCVLKTDPNNFNGEEIRGVLREEKGDPEKVPAGCGTFPQ